MILNHWSKTALATAVGLALTVGLAGCGGGSSDGGSVQPQGVSASGVGVLTGFGSVMMDDDSIFSDDGAKFFIDGVPFSEEAFKAAFGGANSKNVGAVAVVRVRDNVSDDFRSGTAAEVAAHTAVKGPVTGTNPLQVLGQTVVVTGDTVLADLNNVAQLVIGNEVEVYGFTRDDNVIQATRIQRKPAGIDGWKLTGFVTGSNSAGFIVGLQAVSLVAGVTPNDCAGGTPISGNFVETKATPVSGFNPGDALVASKVECKRGGLLGEVDVDDSVTLRRVQGFVSAASINLEAGAGSFTVGGLSAEGQTVIVTANTAFRNGAREDLVTGVKVEVTGNFNTTTRVLTATRVSFREARVRIEAPLQVSDSGTITVLGIPVQGTALVEDDDNAFGGGLAGRDIRVRGFVDRNGNVFATRVEDRGRAGDDDLRLRGPVDANSIFEPRFSILGIEIVPVGNPWQDSRGANEDAPISQQQFFSILTAGQPVQVKGGTFSAGSINGPEEIELED